VTPHLTPAITLILTLIAVTLGYAGACWIWPFKACPRCSGTGKKRSPSGRAFRRCRRCEGTGRRLRAGRWIYNQLARIHRDGSR
jgi:DnaJ-class molecular chaperone